MARITNRTVSTQTPVQRYCVYETRTEADICATVTHAYKCRSVVEAGYDYYAEIDCLVGGDLVKLRCSNIVGLGDTVEITNNYQRGAAARRALFEGKPVPPVHCASQLRAVEWVRANWPLIRQVGKEAAVSETLTMAS